MDEPDIIARQVSSAVETVLYLRLASVDADARAYRDEFDNDFPYVADALNAFGINLTSQDGFLQPCAAAGNSFAQDPGGNVVPFPPSQKFKNLKTRFNNFKDEDDEAFSIRSLAYATSIVVCTLTNFTDITSDYDVPDPTAPSASLRAVTADQIEAYTQYLILVEALWTNLQASLRKRPLQDWTTDDAPISIVLYWIHKRDIKKLEELGALSQQFSEIAEAGTLSEAEMQTELQKFGLQSVALQSEISIEDNSTYFGCLLLISLVADAVSELVHGMGG